MIPFHPLAELLPLIDGSEYAELVASIKTHGKILEPVTLYEGKILDGRNRYRACLEAGVEPTTVEFDGADPVAFVCAKNLYRRHLTPSQRAMFMAKYTTYERGRPAQRENAQNCAFKGDAQNYASPSLTRAEAARLAAVSARTICDAKLVTTNGTDAEIASVVNGEIKVDTAAKTIRKRAKGNRPPVRLPAGYDSLTAALKAAVELERIGIKEDDRHKQIPIARQTYQIGRDVVLLSEIPDLSKSDAARVKQALDLIEGRRQLSKCVDLIKPVAAKVWGFKGNRFKTDKNRSEAFGNSISFVLTSCNATTEMEIPHLNKSQRSEMLASVDEAIASLRALRNRLNRRA